MNEINSVVVSDLKKVIKQFFDDIGRGYFDLQLQKTEIMERIIVNTEDTYIRVVNGCEYLMDNKQKKVLLVFLQPEYKFVEKNGVPHLSITISYRELNWDFKDHLELI